MVKCVCENCGMSGEVADTLAGTALVCRKCGCVVQVPEVNAPPPPRTAASGKGAAKERRGYFIIAALYGAFLICLPFSLIHAKDSSPFCLVMFAVNLALGTTGGFLFLAAVNDPAYPSQWLRLEFTRAVAALVFLPLMALGFALAVHTYSP